MPKQLSCGIEFMRGILLFLNILFIIIGLTLIGLGIYIKVDNSFSTILSKLTDIEGFKGQSLGFLAFVMIGGGVFTLFVALFGCMGTLWHNRCLLYTYALVLAILMIIELVGFGMAFAYKSRLGEVYDTALSDMFEKALKANDTKVVEVFQDLENGLKCCGVHNISDYGNSTYLNKSTTCTTNPAAIGCADAIINILETNLPLIGITLGIVLLIELLGLVGSIALACAIANAPDENYSSRPGEVLSGIVPGRRRNY